MNYAIYAIVVFFSLICSAQADDRPNILWIYLEDVSGWFSCYGDQVIQTPNIDALAERGIRFERFYTCAGVCSAMRSGTIVGAMQTSFGIHNHRSGRAAFRGKSMGVDFDDIRLPQGVKTLPEMMREAGYYTFNEGAKDDYNFQWDASAMYDHVPKKKGWGPAALVAGECWAGKNPDQPFFGQVQLGGGKLGGRAKKRVDRKKVPVPPYYPDIPLVREEIAHHYDCLLTTDEQVGDVVAALKRDGYDSNTLIFLFSDHGYLMHRHKQFLYEGGIHMPLIVAGPRVSQGKVREDLVSSIDIAPATLATAGLRVPNHMEGRNFLADNHKPREFVVAARDRCDYTIERIRAIATPRFKYLRNYLTDRPYMQPNYKDPWAVSQRLREMAKSGELDQVQMQFFGLVKPAEELYDLENDPHEIHNLAADPNFARELARHQKLLAHWIEATGDKGQQTESDAGLLAALKRWGEKCVNPEYERVRPLLKKEATGDKAADTKQQQKKKRN